MQCDRHLRTSLEVCSAQWYQHCNGHRSRDTSGERLIKLAANWCKKLPLDGAVGGNADISLQSLNKTLFGKNSFSIEIQNYVDYVVCQMFALLERNFGVIKAFTKIPCINKTEISNCQELCMFLRKLDQE